MPLYLHVSGEAMLRLARIQAETGRTMSDLAESAIEEAALDYFRFRSDDPAKEEKEDERTSTDSTPLHRNQSFD